MAVPKFGRRAGFGGSSRKKGAGTQRATVPNILIMINIIGLVVIVTLQVSLLSSRSTASSDDALCPCAARQLRSRSVAGAARQRQEQSADRSFREILETSGSDKYERHHYERYYRDWLTPFRSKHGVKLLEIGAERGRSLQVWQNYFEDPGPIVGLAYGHQTENVETVADSLDKIQVIRGDQSHEGTMDLLRQKGPWDIIIDDGSHVPAHMVFSFFRLWKSVKPGGLYVIEDLETNYWREQKELYGYRMQGTGIAHGPETNAVAKFKQFIDVLNRYQIGAKELSVMDGDADICSIEWGMNLVAFKKCSAEDKATATPPMQGRAKYKPTELIQWLQQAKASNPAAKG